ncbi:MAG: MBL fold metallo-hydrolase [Mycobacteriales bacterium]
MTDYTGAVRVGGPAQRRELEAVSISKLAVGPMDNNAYLLVDRASGEALLIDAANEAHRLLELIGATPLVGMVTTHRHGDHWQALAQVAGASGAPVAAHPLDAPELPVRVTRLIEHGDTVQVGRTTLEVIHLRGHTPGSVALLLQDEHPHLFTGDSLFPGGVGNTFGDSDAFASLIDDVTTRVFERLPDDTWVYPGHGGDTTLGAERPHLEEWRARGW